MSPNFTTSRVKGRREEATIFLLESGVTFVFPPNFFDICWFWRPNKKRCEWGWDESKSSTLNLWNKQLTCFSWASLVAQTVKNSPAMQETRIQSLDWEDPLEKGMATLSSILAWRIPWTEEPGRLQSMGFQRVGHKWATNTVCHTHRLPSWIPQCWLHSGFTLRQNFTVCNASICKTGAGLRLLFYSE